MAKVLMSYDQNQSLLARIADIEAAKEEGKRRTREMEFEIEQLQENLARTWEDLAFELQQNDKLPEDFSFEKYVLSYDKVSRVIKIKTREEMMQPRLPRELAELLGNILQREDQDKVPGLHIVKDKTPTV